ncbi:MAG TPA: LamG-like jellyroll fold domain-containing protein [Polyangiaceae bacterium]
MRRLFSRNAKIALAVLPVAIGCALAKQGDPPLPIPDDDGGDGQTGGTTTGGTATGGAATGGVSGTTTGGTATGGAATGGTATGGAATGGTATGGTTSGGTTTGGTTSGGSGGAGTTGGSAGKGGTATGGTAGSTTTGGMGGRGGTTTAGSGGRGGNAGGPPGGMELFRDDFEMGAGNWTATPSGVWAIAMDGSSVYAATGASANSTWRAGAAGQTSWTDVQIDARVKVTSFAGSSTSYYAGVCARYTSNSSYACFALRSDGKIAFRVNGSNTSSASPSGGDIQEGTWYTIRVVARGANITAFVNGTEIPSGSRVTSSENPPATGRLALAAPGTNVVFDDIVVSTP